MSLWTVLAYTFWTAIAGLICCAVWWLSKAQTDGQQSAMGDAIDSIGVWDGVRDGSDTQ